MKIDRIEVFGVAVKDTLLFNAWIGILPLDEAADRYRFEVKDTNG